MLERQYKKWLEYRITYAKENNVVVSTIGGVIEAVGGRVTVRLRHWLRGRGESFVANA